MRVDQMNIYQSNKDLNSAASEGQPVKAASEGKIVLWTCPDMTKIFHARSHGRFTEIQGNLRRKIMWAPQLNLEEKDYAMILKDDFCVITSPAILTSIAPVLLDWSNETSWVFPALKSKSHILS